MNRDETERDPRSVSGLAATNRPGRVGRGLLFVVSAPSGAGKTSLCNEIMKWVPNLQHSISYTTRPIRPTERNGRDYHFISEGRFQEMIRVGDFLEWAIVHNHYYGTSLRDLRILLSDGIDVILDIDSQGAMQIRKRHGNGVFIYILPPSFEDLERRLTLRRADAPEEIARRLQRARDEIKDFQVYDYLIINDELQNAREQLKAIISAERGRMSSAAQQWIQTTFLSGEDV